MDRIFSSTLKAGSRNYFFDINKSQKGEFYLKITENRSKGDDNYEIHRIMIFEENIENFINELNYVYNKFILAKNNKLK